MRISPSTDRTMCCTPSHYFLIRTKAVSSPQVTLNPVTETSTYTLHCSRGYLLFLPINAVVSCLLISHPAAPASSSVCQLCGEGKTSGCPLGVQEKPQTSGLDWIWHGGKARGQYHTAPIPTHTVTLSTTPQLHL